MSSNIPRLVDEEFEEQFVHCQICTQKFDQVERVPKTLPCHHTFCLPCLDQISRTRQGRLRCPMCNQECRVAGTCKDLPTDHKIISLLDWMAKATSNHRNTCSKHTGEKTFFVCKTCSVPVCHQCTVLDHKESNGHVIADIKSILTKQDDRMRSVEKNSKDILQKLGIKLDGLRKSLQALDKSKSQHTEKIKQRFMNFRQMLDKYEKDLISRECQRNKLQTDLLQAQHDSLYEQVTQFQKLFDDFQEEDEDVTKLLKTANKISQQENRLQQLVSSSIISTDDVTQRNEEAFQTDMRSAESIWSELNLEDIERQIDRLSFTQTKGAEQAGLNTEIQASGPVKYNLEVSMEGLGDGAEKFSEKCYINQLQCNAMAKVFLHRVMGSCLVGSCYLCFDRDPRTINYTFGHPSTQNINVRFLKVDPAGHEPVVLMQETTRSWEQIVQKCRENIMRKRPATFDDGDTTCWWISDPFFTRMFTTDFPSKMIRIEIEFKRG